jgi:hypothetical protein
MATRRGGSAAAAKIRELPQAFLERVLPGAGRAGGKVIAEDARQTLGGRRADTAGGGKVLIADSVKVKVRRKGTTIRVRITLDGPGAYVGRWLEYGTAPHLISVTDEAREGRSVSRINKLAVEGSLVIGDKFVGQSVSHPGAKPHPFLRPALDQCQGDAIAAMQTYVTSRATRAGIAGTEPGGDE